MCKEQTQALRNCHTHIRTSVLPYKCHLYVLEQDWELTCNKASETKPSIICYQHDCLVPKARTQYETSSHTDSPPIHSLCYTEDSWIEQALTDTSRTGHWMLLTITYLRRQHKYCRRWSTGEHRHAGFSQRDQALWMAQDCSSVCKISVI